MKSRNGMKKQAARMARNQKIQCQPAYCDIIPPRMGPREGARMVAREVIPM
jgi:hypothetical protein